MKPSKSLLHHHLQRAGAFCGSLTTATLLFIIIIIYTTYFYWIMGPKGWIKTYMQVAFTH